MGNKYVLDGASFTDEKFPKIYDDERLTDGSLLMFDASHSMAGLSSVPAHGAMIPNIAGNTAAGLIDGATPENTAFEMYNTFTGGRGVFELTTKGALHGAVINGAQNGERAYLMSPDSFVDYITNNPDRDYALFIWANVTRVATSASNYYDSIPFFNAAAASSNSLLASFLSNNAGGQRLEKNAPTGMSGSPNSNAGLNQGSVFAWGNISAYDSLNSDNARSVVLYCVHVIDVAASGMTFAELSARDAELYTAAFAPGGRYYNDSYTAADTLAPES